MEIAETSAVCLLCQRIGLSCLPVAAIATLKGVEHATFEGAKNNP